MARNLNDDIYTRFDLKLTKTKVTRGFRLHISNLMWSAFYPINYPTQYDDSLQDALVDAKDKVLKDCCRGLLMDYSDYTDTSGIRDFIKDVFEVSSTLEELLANIQIVMNVFWKYEVLHDELNELGEEIKSYSEDFPILGIIVKEYKTKAPQIFPSNSKHLDKEIIDTLGVLDLKKYKSALDDFEEGLKFFSKAKTDSQFKNVVDKMHASCDEIVKVILNDNHKSFKHVTNKDIHKKLGITGYQKEIFKNLKLMMDGIKHGSKRNIEKSEIEMIVSMTALFIRILSTKSKIK